MISFDCQPQNETPNLESFYFMYLRNNKLTLRPPYQRSVCWTQEQKSELLDTIMGRCPMPPFLVYKYENEMECIDGQNRLTTIKEYYEQTPPCAQNHDTRPFAWVVHHLGNIENSENKKKQDIQRTEYIFYQETPEFATYLQNLNKKNNRKGKEYRFMTEEEKARFNDYGLVAQMIKTPLNPDQRKAIFNKWQNGSSISQCDALKNEDSPFCQWVVSSGIEGRLVPKVACLLKSKSKNWLFDIFRLLSIFMQPVPLSYGMISTLQARTAMKTLVTVSQEEMEPVVEQLESFLDKMEYLHIFGHKMTISLLLFYAYEWHVYPSRQSAMENRDFMLGFTGRTLTDHSSEHSTLNNGPQVRHFLDYFPQLENEFIHHYSHFLEKSAQKSHSF